MNFILNGRLYQIGNGDRLYYEDILWLLGYNKDEVISVGYNCNGTKGTLTKGQNVIIRDGMVVNAFNTTGA